MHPKDEVTEEIPRPVRAVVPPQDPQPGYTGMLTMRAYTNRRRPLLNRDRR